MAATQFEFRKAKEGVMTFNEESSFFSLSCLSFFVFPFDPKKRFVSPGHKTFKNSNCVVVLRAAYNKEVDCCRPQWPRRAM